MMTETSVWYALRTFNCQELALAKFLEERGYSYFIPMTYTTKGRGGVAVARHLVPAVHNLVFLPKPDDVETFNATLADCKIPVHVFRKLDSKDYYEIPDIEMREFRLLCDPDYEGSQFITLQEAEAKVGKEVRVVHGPFAGITGRLVRKRNEYYFIKTMMEVGVMLRISRWYCEPVPEKSS